jgi:hypothetical protein
MLHFTLIRKYRKDAYTIGQLYANGKFVCNTIEDVDRGLNNNMSLAAVLKVKVPNETAIPTGTYQLIVSMSPKFKRELIEVRGVVGFSGIRIHRGNTAADSAGCIIVGINSEKGKVTNSTMYETMVTKMVSDAIASNEECYLTII